jgi:hypothetical protein
MGVDAVLEGAHGATADLKGMQTLTVARAGK